MFPEQLYLPTAYDYAVGIAPRRYLESIVVTSAAATDDINFTAVPPNKLLLLTGWMLSYGPTAATAEFIQQCNVVIQSDDGGVTATRGFLLLRESLSGGLSEPFSDHAEPDVMLMPGEYVSSAVQKSGALNNFRHTLTAWGFLLPRANIQTG